MSSPNPWLSRAFVRSLLLFVPLALIAQSAPTDATEAQSDPVYELSPFIVSTSKDSGFIAASALAGGRLATPLNETPVAYSVLTREFLDALSLTDMTAATRWTVNANNVSDDGRGTLFADEASTKLTFRGVQSNQQQIDFFPVFYDFDSYSLERIDYARGPNSILFGSGSFGGTPNAMAKVARINHTNRDLRVAFGSWDMKRITADLNEPLGDKLAVRTNLLWQEGETWRDRELTKKTAGSLALSYRPWKGGEVRANADIGRFKRNIALATLGDQVSGWDGVTTFSAPLLSLPSDANARGIARNGSSTSIYPVYIPSLGNAGIINWANTAATVGGNLNAAVPIGGQVVVGASGTFTNQPILNGLNRPANAFALAEGGSFFRVPGRSFTTSPDGPTFIQDYSTYTLTANQQVTKRLFVEFAANYADADKWTDYTVVRGLERTYIDINQNLPTGAPNPNFKHPYNESFRFYNTTDYLAHNYRASATYVLEKTSIGDFRLMAQIGTNKRTGVRSQYIYVMRDPTLDPREWPQQNGVRYRYYWNTAARPEPDLGTINFVNPVTGATTAMPTGFVLDTRLPANTNRSIEDYGYGQVALHARLLKGKLNLLGAIRSDDYEVTPSQSELRRDYPTDWNGQTIIYRPAAPADYFTLRYTPKNSSGVATGPEQPALSRPRASNGDALAQYAGDRFQDDFSTPVVKGKVTTYSLGSVYAVTNQVSVFANYAETYNPPSPALRVNGGVFQPLLSTGWDAGLRFELMEGKASLSFTRYSGEQDNVVLGTGTGDGLPVALPAAINTIIDANRIGDSSPNGTNARGVQGVPAVFSDTATRATEGWEIELVANLASDWRVLANLSLPEATQSEAYGDTRAYLTANDAVLKQILADAGVLVGTNNVATVDLTVPVGSQSPDASAAAAAWNNLQTAKANFVTGNQPITRLNKLTANLFTDYTFSSGPAKGLRIGAGVNWRGRETIGFRGADTIVSSSNSASAIDDPTVDALTPVEAGGYHIVTATLGYSWKFSGRRTLRLNLTVNNLLNEDRPLYYNAVQRPVGGNVTSPARVATPAQYSYLDPRSYSLAATFNF